MDTEFLEGTQKRSFLQKLFGIKNKPTIDLISIGLVAEDGREYYAISKDFNLKEAWNRFDLVANKELSKISIEDRQQAIYDPYQNYKNNLKYDKVYWIRENVLKPIYNDLCAKRTTYEKTWFPNLSEPFSYNSLKYLIRTFGKTNEQIAKEVKAFVYEGSNCTNTPELWGKEIKPEFYGYYADYDWVVFCWLFGKMINLPDGFPKYCKDLEQILDEILEREYPLRYKIHKGDISSIKIHPDYPKQENEHNALVDARWNKKLHEFILKL